MEKKALSILIQLISLIALIILISIVLFTPSFFDFSWNQSLRDNLKGFDLFFRIITELGGTIVYFALVFTIFWGVNKKTARNLFLIYFSSNFVNYYAKSIIANPRPPESKWIMSGASHLSTPSGHTMSSTVVWGYIGIRAKKVFMLIGCIIIFILVGLSRVYLGVHWMGDVLTGWFFGITILILVNLLEDPLSNHISEDDLIKVYLGLAIFGLGIMLLTELLFHSSEYNSGAIGGEIIGLGVGLALEHKYVQFEIENESKKLVRILIGLIIVGALYLSLYLVLPSSIFWLVAIQYIIVLIVGIFLWPLIFKKLGY